MPRANGVAPDALRLTERTNAAPFLGKVVGDDLRAHHILSGLTAATNPDAAAAEAKVQRRAARFIIRSGRDDHDRAELLDAFGLTWEQASPAEPETAQEPAAAQEAEPTKHCPRCQTERPLTAFHKDASTRDGLNCWCAPCHTEAVADARAAAAVAPKEPVTEQDCRTCKKTLPADCFAADKYTRTGLTNQCKTCRNAQTRAARATKNRASSTRPTTERKTA